MGTDIRKYCWGVGDYTRDHTGQGGDERLGVELAKQCQNAVLKQLGSRSTDPCGIMWPMSVPENIFLGLSKDPDQDFVEDCA